MLGNYQELKQATLEIDDNILISDFVENRSERAATAIVRKYQKFVYSTALRFLQSYDDADDVSQEVFIRALSSLNNFRGSSSLKTWLYKITRNLCINALRRKKILSFFSASASEDELEIIATNSSADREIENKEFNRKFSQMLKRLPEKQREVFALRYFEELPYEEISKMLGTTVGGLKANYFQAVQKLAKFLKED